MTSGTSRAAAAAERPTRRSPKRWARRVVSGVIALFLLLPWAVSGQESGEGDGRVPVEATADPSAEATAAPAAAPAGEPFVAPRSGRAYSHVFLAFGIAWVLMLGFVVVLGRRFAAVERDLARLGGARE